MPSQGPQAALKSMPHVDDLCWSAHCRSILVSRIIVTQHLLLCDGDGGCSGAQLGHNCQQDQLQAANHSQSLTEH